MYTSLDSLLTKYRDVKDYTNHLLAAFSTGVIFKCTGQFAFSEKLFFCDKD